MTGRQWAIGGCLVALVGAVGLTVLAASCAVMVRRQVDVREGQQAETFDREAEAILARLGDVPPLIEDTPTGPRLSPGNLERRKALAGQKRPEALWVLVWAEDEQKIVRLSLPFWLLRMSPRDIDINVDDVDLGKLRLSVDDIERAGPGPLLVRDDEHSRVLVWTE
jgi:hypothetical protein